MALTAQHKATILAAFQRWAALNAPDPQQQVLLLLQLMFQTRANQIAKVREWLAFVRDNATSEKAGLTTFVTDRDAALTAQIGQLDAADTELTGIP